MDDDYGTQFIRSGFVLVLDLFQIILKLTLEIIDLNITSLRSERSSSRKVSDEYYSTRLMYIRMGMRAHNNIIFEKGAKIQVLNSTVR